LAPAECRRWFLLFSECAAKYTDRTARRSQVRLTVENFSVGNNATISDRAIRLAI